MIAYKVSASVMNYRAFDDYINYCENQLGLMVLPIDSISAYLVIEDSEQLEEVQREAQRSAMCTHNHSDGIKGAMSVASAIYLVRMGKSKEELKHYIENNFGYDLSRKTADIRPAYQFNESCQGTVPEAIICYLESTGFEDAIRLAVSLGGDSDTLACITGSIAEAESSCAIPMDLLKVAIATMPAELRNEFSRFIYTYRVGKTSLLNT